MGRRLQGGPIFARESEHQNDRSGRDDESITGESADGRPASDNQNDDPQNKEPHLEIVNATAHSKVYDDFLRQPIAGIYFQADDRLSDLFDDDGASQLCWPAAMAYQMRYQRTLRDPSFTKLPDVAKDLRDGEAKRAAETRYFATSCTTDPKTGTTVPQGTACLEKHYKSAGLLARLTITGIDAQWAAFGMYPAGTAARSKPVSSETIRADLDEGRSIIMLIGFYTYDSDRDAWVRERGHFVSVVGYGLKESWEEGDLTLRLANPANDYVSVGTEEAYDSVRMTSLDKDLPGRAPDGVKFQLAGGSIPGDPYLAVVESTVAFDAARH